MALYLVFQKLGVYGKRILKSIGERGFSILEREF
jgi:hypothetical protein